MQARQNILNEQLRLRRPQASSGAMSLSLIHCGSHIRAAWREGCAPLGSQARKASTPLLTSAPANSGSHLGHRSKHATDSPKRMVLVNDEEAD